MLKQTILHIAIQSFMSSDKDACQKHVIHIGLLISEEWILIASKSA